MARPLSPARAHFERVSAAERTAAEVSPVREGSTAYELQLVQLAEHKRRLKEIQAIDRKVAFKLDVLPQYLPWVQGVLEADQAVQDDVVMTVMVWMLDIGNLAGAVEIARHALKHGLTMPDQYARSVAAVLAEDAAQLTLKQIGANEPVNLDTLIEVEELTDTHDMHDQIRAKLHKAIGYALRAGERNVEALEHLKRALQLDERSGVKKDIERLQTVIKNSAGTDTNGNG